MAGGLVLAVLVVAVALALALRGGPARTTAGLSHGRARGRLSATRTTGASRRTRRSDRLANSPSAPRPKSPIAVSPAAAATFEADGHQLLTSGRYGAAIGDLRDAIEASGGSLASCSQPTTEACLTYAYALYDLGRALQLDGDPAAAIPVLNRRLRIDNQREVVAQELELARKATA
jgi:tetratricopeptide (TPR) repeat protein